MQAENKRFDIIIVGASKEGRSLAKQLEIAMPNKSIALVSNRFPIEDQAFKKSSITTITETIEFILYNKGLIGLVCAGNTQPVLFCTQLILATGTKSGNLYCRGSSASGIYNYLAEIPKGNSDETCIVLGSTKKAIRLALLASNRFKKVYFCPESFTFAPALQQKINNLALKPNVQIIYGGNPIEIVTDSTGKASGVFFDTDTVIDCNAVLVALNSVPDTSWMPATLVPKYSDGYIMVNPEYQSLRVPTIYAIGDIVRGYNRTQEKHVLEAIINQKIGG